MWRNNSDASRDSWSSGSYFQEEEESVAESLRSQYVPPESRIADLDMFSDNFMEVLYPSESSHSDVLENSDESFAEMFQWMYRLEIETGPQTTPPTGNSPPSSPGRAPTSAAGPAGRMAAAPEEPPAAAPAEPLAAAQAGRFSAAAEPAFPAPAYTPAQILAKQWATDKIVVKRSGAVKKSDVHHAYALFARGKRMVPLNRADFGKIMKATFPAMVTRRLGPRWDSRYHHCGIDWRGQQPGSRRSSSGASAQIQKKKKPATHKTRESQQGRDSVPPVGGPQPRNGAQVSHQSTPTGPAGNKNTEPKNRKPPTATTCTAPGAATRIQSAAPVSRQGQVKKEDSLAGTLPASGGYNTRSKSRALQGPPNDPSPKVAAGEYHQGDEGCSDFLC